MVAQPGSLMLLKVAKTIYKMPYNFLTVGGMRSTRFILNNQIIDVTHKESGKWRHLLDSAGTSSMNVSGSGIFTNEESEQLVRELAFTGSVAIFQITFGNGDTLEGPFLVSTYERSGSVGDEENYNISLESAGKIEYL